MSSRDSRLAADDKGLEEALRTRLLRLNATVQGVVTGIVTGLALFIATNWLVLKGGVVVGPHLALLDQFFIGYRVTFVGSLIGFGYGFICGFLGGYSVSTIYNWLAHAREGTRFRDQHRASPGPQAQSAQGRPSSEPERSGLTNSVLPRCAIGPADSKQGSNVWLVLYCLICISLFLPLVIWGLRDPTSLEPLLVPGGLIESMPVVVLAVASLLSLAVALRLLQRKQPYKGWVFYSGLCFFLAAEEAAWGGESVLGWQALTGTEEWDVHNWIIGLLGTKLRMLGWNNISGITLLFSGVAVVFGMLFFLMFRKRGETITTLFRGFLYRLPQTFFLLGLILIITANFIDVLWEVGLPTFHGQWTLEESLELLGSVAFLFVPLYQIDEDIRSLQSGGRLGRASVWLRGVIDKGVFGIMKREWILLGIGFLVVLPTVVTEFSDLPYRLLFGEPYHDIDTSKNVVALTFDDGPHPVYTMQILDVLDRDRVKATFFMLGQRIEENPEIAKAVFVRGHELGNHSYSHPWMVLASPSFVRSEIDKADLLLRNLGVSGDIHFRSPFGAQLVVLPYILLQKKKKNILFDVVPKDWETQDPALLTQRVLERAKPGSIILLHDGGGERPGTVQALETIIRELKARGFQFVTVSQLLTYAER